MGSIATQKMLETFVANSARGRTVPLISTSYEIEVLSGVAVVRQTRVFRNSETVPIEAVMTFPVAFEGVVTRLEALVAGRRLRGAASPKVEARQKYEAAVDGGKAAVLHEELMRGLHMVSVANVAPGTEIAVDATYVMPVSLSSEHPHLRIPQTVGDIYGRLPLQDSDQLVTGGTGGWADVKVSASSGTAFVNGTLPKDGVAKVGLDDQIVIRVEGLELAPLAGRAADGRDVLLSFRRLETRDIPLDLDLMVDVSGSMREAAGRSREEGSKWHALKSGACRAAARLRPDDSIRLWAFGDDCRLIGSLGPSALPSALDAMGEPRGGTYLVEAVNKVVAARPEANVLLVTDGKSATGTELDIEGIVATGARITVVLIGGDALEARVGHLAAQSGGQMFVAHGTDSALAVETAMASMRSVVLPARKSSSPPTEASRTAAGLVIDARWGEVEAAGGVIEHVGAYAASLALSGMDRQEASLLAASEGLVSHLTSIVLMDEEGAALERIPEQRKVALPAYGLALRGGDRIHPIDIRMQATGEAHILHNDQVVRSGSFYADPQAGAKSMLVGSMPTKLSSGRRWIEVAAGASWPVPGGSADVPFGIRDTSSVRPFPFEGIVLSDPVLPPPDVEYRSVILGGPEPSGSERWLDGSAQLLSGLVWDDHVASLTNAQPDFAGVPLAATAVFMRVAAVSWVKEVALAAGLDPRSLAVGMMALIAGGGDRTAARIARRLLKGVPEDAVESLRRKLETSI